MRSMRLTSARCCRYLAQVRLPLLRVYCTAPNCTGLAQVH